jgi:predicted PhzF superfamily epimerase YddE/YHI9
MAVKSKPRGKTGAGKGRSGAGGAKAGKAGALKAGAVKAGTVKAGTVKAGAGGGARGKAVVKGSGAKGSGRKASRTAGEVRPATPATRIATLPMFQVDAFTSRVFHGNPAAVVPLEEWLDAGVMQAIAAENNLAETAFIVPKKKGEFEIRWFTPLLEMDLCGHATLASAHVLFEHVGIEAERVVFRSKSGPLPVERSDDGLLELDFPARPASKVRVTAAMSSACGHEPSEAYLARDLMLVFENRRAIYDMEPDMIGMRNLDGFGVIVTAPGSGHDFVSRFFAPKAGVPEDPVTGSAHCTLAPYWGERLGKSMLMAHQVSRRGGEMRCECVKGRVKMAGHAVTFFDGRIRVPLEG